MYKDEVVDEVRRVREDLAKEFDYELDALFDYLKSKEVTGNRKYVNFPPQYSTHKVSPLPVPSVDRAE